jgi:hypothetical protein
MKRMIQLPGVASSFKYREARMEIRADRGAHSEEDEGRERVRGPRVTKATVGQPETARLRYIPNGVSFDIEDVKLYLKQD